MPKFRAGLLGREQIYRLCRSPNQLTMPRLAIEMITRSGRGLYFFSPRCFLRWRLGALAAGLHGVKKKTQQIMKMLQPRA